MTTLEFWPDYGSGPLWVDGKAIDLLSIGLPHELAHEIAAWNREYAEDKLPLEGPGDVAWLNEGVTLRTGCGPRLESAFLLCDRNRGGARDPI